MKVLREFEKPYIDEQNKVTNPAQPIADESVDRKDARAVAPHVYKAALSAAIMLAALTAMVAEQMGASSYKMNLKKLLSFMRKGVEGGIPCDIARSSVAFDDVAGVLRGLGMLMTLSGDANHQRGGVRFSSGGHPAAESRYRVYW